MFEETANNEGAISAAPSKSLSRRQLVKAGVWAAPVVVLATASPAAAVSVTGASLTAAITGSTSNSRSYLLTLVISGATSPKTVAISPIVSAQQGLTVTFNTNFPTSTTTAGTYTATITVAGADKKTATITVSVDGVSSNPVTVSRT